MSVMEIFIILLYLNDILKIATGPKPNVTLVWCMQVAWVTSKHRNIDRYRRVVRDTRLV